MPGKMAGLPMLPKKIFAPIASANTLFRIAVECGDYTPERAAADIAALRSATKPV